MKHTKSINTSLADGLRAVASQLPTLTERIQYAHEMRDVRPIQANTEALTDYLDGRCLDCGESERIHMRPEDKAVYLNTPKHIRPSVQELFPYLSDNQRERLISGICGKCFDAMFV